MRPLWSTVSRSPSIFRPAPLLIATVTSFLWCYYVLFGSSSVPELGPGFTSADKQLFRSHAIDNTVVIIPVNTGMLRWAENLVCSLSAIDYNTSSLVFWALDQGADDYLSESGFATYRDPTLFSTSSNENLHGDTAAYKRMMKERPKFWINLLSAGFDMLMLDADTVFWQSPLKLVPGSQDDHVDAVFSTDAREFYQDHNAFRDDFRRGTDVPPICNGIFWMRASYRTVSLWAEMLARFNTPWPFGWIRNAVSRFNDDQRGMDVLLNDGRAGVVEPLPGGITPDMVPEPPSGKSLLGIRLLDQTQVVSGHLLMNRLQTYETNLASLRSKGEDRISAHFNWDTTKWSKEEGARRFGMMFLDDNGQCTL